VAIASSAYRHSGGTIRTDQEDTALAEPAAKMKEQINGSRVGPVEVSDEEEQGLILGHVSEDVRVLLEDLISLPPDRSWRPAPGVVLSVPDPPQPTRHVRAQLSSQSRPRNEYVDQSGAEFGNRAGRGLDALPEATGIPVSDGAFGQLAVEIPGQHSEQLVKGQEGIAGPCLGVAVSDSEHEVGVRLRGSARELGQEGGLPRASLACHEADGELTGESGIE
jgi:hypothetical protein